MCYMDASAMGILAQLVEVPGSLPMTDPRRFLYCTSSLFVRLSFNPYYSLSRRQIDDILLMFQENRILYLMQIARVLSVKMYPYLVLIFSSFDASGGLFFVVVAFLGYLYLYFCC